MIVEGLVEVTNNSPNKLPVLKTIGKNCSFGELSFFNG
jgi:hypothetical protein